MFRPDFKNIWAPQTKVDLIESYGCLGLIKVRNISFKKMDLPSFKSTFEV